MFLETMRLQPHVDQLRRSAAKWTRSLREAAKRWLELQDESKFRKSVNSAVDAQFLHDPATGAILDVNDTMLEMYGYSRAECADLTVEDVSVKSPEFTEQAARANIARAMQEGKISFEWRARHRDGREFPVEVTLKRMGVGGQVLVAANVHDITAAKVAEDNLRRTQSSLAALIESTDDIVCAVDTEIRLVTFNRRMEQTVREFNGTDARMGASPEICCVPEIAVLWRRWFSRALAEGAFRHEFSTIKGGLTLELSFNPFVNGDRTIGVSLFGKDITAKKHAEQSLRENEQRLRAVFESAQDAIGVAKAGVHVFANPAYLRLHGFASNEQLVGASILDRVAPSYRTQLIENIAGAKLAKTSPRLMRRAV